MKNVSLLMTNVLNMMIMDTVQNVIKDMNSMENGVVLNLQLNLQRILDVRHGIGIMESV